MPEDSTQTAPSLCSEERTLQSQKKILFIDDDPILGPVYESQIKKAGYDVTLAKDGEAGLTALQQKRPDLVVLDINLPKVSGIELLKILNSTEGFQYVPVIVFTSAFQQEVLNEIKLQNPKRILPKSRYVPLEVIKIIRGLLNDSPANGEPAEAEHPSFARGESAASVVLRKQLPKFLEQCRQLVREANKSPLPDLRSSKLRSLRSVVQTLSGGAAAAGLKAQAYFCDALATLTDEAVDNGGKAGATTLRTITQAVDFLFEEFNFDKIMTVPADLEFNILVVDDDAISRRAICVALGRIKLTAAEASEVTEALQATRSKAFDLIFLDVDMPERNGFDLCTEIRKMELNKAVPIIFVTGMTDLQSRANSMLSGGTDFIGKPFQFMELAVKSLIHLLRSKLR